MPAFSEYENHLNPAGRRVLDLAIEHMRNVGSGRLQQEHLILALATEYDPLFEKYGAGIKTFKRIFEVEPSAPRFSGPYQIEPVIGELIRTAPAWNAETGSRRAGPLGLLGATINHHSERLRRYLMHAHMLSREVYDDTIPDLLWEDALKKTVSKPKLTVVA